MQPLAAPASLPGMERMSFPWTDDDRGAVVPGRSPALRDGSDTTIGVAPRATSSITAPRATGPAPDHQSAQAKPAGRVGSRTAGVPFDWQRPTPGPPRWTGRASISPTSPTSRAPGAADAVGEFARVAVTSGARAAGAAVRARRNAHAGRAAVRDSGGE